MTTELTGDRAPDILLIEDNEDDVMLTRLAFDQAKLDVILHHARDGEDGMAYLRKQGEYADAAAPDLVLLDLNMPRKDGREVLAEITADEGLRHLPVVILTTSNEDREILKMYQLRASSYIVKPVDFDKFQRVVRSVHEYWFSAVALPGGARA